MLEFLGLLFPLLAPVAALLFLNLRLSRRLRYPHDFLREDRRRGPASLLFSLIRAHYDIILDALIALVLCFAILDAGPGPGPARGKRALVIDCSRSMLAGLPGSRPIDLAFELLEANPDLKRRKAFALAFDPSRAKSRLYELEPLLGDRAGTAAAVLLASELSFFSVDYQELSALRRRGFRDILLLTDLLPGRPEGFSAVELGFGGIRRGTELTGGLTIPLPPEGMALAGGEVYGVYPAAARYDRMSDSYVITIVESAPAASLELGGWNPSRSRFEPLPASRYRIDPFPGGQRISVQGPGLYNLSLRGPAGQAAADFPIRLGSGRRSAEAVGPFSELLLKVFPLLERTPRPELVLADLGARLPEAGSETSTIIRSGITEAEGEYLFDPALSGGRSIAAAFLMGSDFGLGPSSLANEDLILAFDGAIQESIPEAFASSLDLPAPRLLPAGASFLSRDSKGLLPLIPPASEFFPERPRGRISLSPTGASRVLWTGLLALLALAKILLWRKISGKPLLTRS